MARINSKAGAMFCAALFAMSWGGAAMAQGGGDGAGGTSGTAPHLRCASDKVEPDFASQPAVGKARIQIKKSEVKGALDKAIVNRVVRHHSREILECYKQSLRVRPEIEGEIGLKFLIGPQGKVKASMIASDTIGDQALRACLTDGAKTWQFPKPKGSMVEVVAPLRFYLEPMPEPKEASSSGFGGVSTSGYGMGGGAGISGGADTMTTPDGGEAASCNPGTPGDDEDGLVDATESKKIPKIIRRPVMVGPGGALSKEIIRRVIREHHDEVDACYANRFIRSSEGGKLRVEFAIDGKGNVTRAGVIENELNDGRVEGCLTEEIRGWRFPEPKGGGTVIVKYPFTFEPAE